MDFLSDSGSKIGGAAGSKNTGEDNYVIPKDNTAQGGQLPPILLPLWVVP